MVQYESMGACKQGVKKRRRKRTAASPKALQPTKRQKQTNQENVTPAISSLECSLPSGSWEDEIQSIDTIESDGVDKLVAYVTWKSAKRTKNGVAVLYDRCPQKVLQEVFKPCREVVC